MKGVLKKIAILAAPVIWRRIRGRRHRHQPRGRRHHHGRRRRGLWL